MKISDFHVILVLWINFVLCQLPRRCVRTYAELLIGAMISGSGHITAALLAVGHQKHFSTYYWLIEHGKWSWLKISKIVIKLIVTVFPRDQWNLIVDDFICPRSTEHAPGSKFHFDHSKKPNRPKFIWGQQWVALGLSLNWGRMCVALPLLLGLHKGVGNRSKITKALAMIKSVLQLFKDKGLLVIRCLVDAWYMKRTFILPLIKIGLKVIGQVRKDTALFEPPVLSTGPVKKRGRPKKYGEKLTADRVEKLPIFTATLNIYGSLKKVRYRSILCLARFLKGHPVIAVWCQLPDQKNWTLILSTDLTLCPEKIIKLYARRWKIEPMFNEIKNSYGVGEAWEQTSQNLHRWTSMLCASYTLTRMLSVIVGNKKNQNFTPLIQWRVNKPITAGLVRQGLDLFFRHFGFYRLWEPKSKKLRLPKVPKNGKKYQIE